MKAQSAHQLPYCLCTDSSKPSSLKSFKIRDAGDRCHGAWVKKLHLHFGVLEDACLPARPQPHTEHKALPPWGGGVIWEGGFGPPSVSPRDSISHLVAVTILPTAPSPGQHESCHADLKMCFHRRPTLEMAPKKQVRQNVDYGHDYR